MYLYEMRNHPKYELYLEEWKQYPGQFIRNPVLKNPHYFQEDPDRREHIYFNDSLLNTYLKEDFYEDFSEEVFTTGLLRNRNMNELFHEITPCILHEDDLNSMYYSVENRSPYLDRNLFDFAFSIPEEYLIQSGYGKYILREALNGILNDQTRLDRRKKGFNASIHSIIDFSSKKDREYLLDDGPIFDIFNKNKIESLFNQNPLPNSLNKFLFSFINMKIFFEKN